METSIEKARSKVGFDTCMTGVCYKSAMGKVWMEADPYPMTSKEVYRLNGDFYRESTQ